MPPVGRDMLPHAPEVIETRALRSVRIRCSEAISPGVYVLSLPRGADFRPGQVVAVTVDRTIPPRLFSLCSGPRDPDWQILFDVKPDGLLSPRLATLTAGDSLLVSDPFGTFAGDGEDDWWIAAGTGIAPFRAMLRAGQGRAGRLIHGSRTPERFFFQDAFHARLGDRYVRCCSGAAGTGLYHGRLTAWLRETPLPSHPCLFCLCGSPEMVVEVRDILIARGIAIASIRSEIYF